MTVGIAVVPLTSHWHLVAVARRATLGIDGVMDGLDIGVMDGLDIGVMDGLDIAGGRGWMASSRPEASRLPLASMGYWMARISPEPLSDFRAMFLRSSSGRE